MSHTEGQGDTTSRPYVFSRQGQEDLIPDLYPGTPKLGPVEKDNSVSALRMFIFFGIVILLGVLGNCCTLYVYGCVVKREFTRTIVISLMLFDMLALFIVVPLHLIVLYNTLYFQTPTDGLCRSMWTMQIFYCVGSGGIIVFFTYEQQRKLRLPFSRPGEDSCRLKAYVALVCLIAIAASVPSIFISGLTNYQTKINGFFHYGAICYVNNEYFDTLTTFIYHSILSGLGVGATLFIIIMNTITCYILVQCSTASKSSTFKNPAGMDLNGTTTKQDQPPNLAAIVSEERLLTTDEYAEHINQPSMFINGSTVLNNVPLVFRTNKVDGKKHIPATDHPSYTLCKQHFNEHLYQSSIIFPTSSFIPSKTQKCSRKSLKKETSGNKGRKLPLSDKSFSLKRTDIKESAKKSSSAKISLPRSRIGSGDSEHWIQSTVRAAWVLLLITVCMVIHFLPHAIVLLFITYSKDPLNVFWLTNTSFSWQLAIRSVFIRSAMNPFVFFARDYQVFCNLLKCHNPQSKVMTNPGGDKAWQAHAQKEFDKTSHMTGSDVPRGLASVTVQSPASIHKTQWSLAAVCSVMDIKPSQINSIVVPVNQENA